MNTTKPHAWERSSTNWPTSSPTRLAFLPGWNPVIVGTVVVLSGLTEMTSMVGQTLTGIRRNDGPMGKSDRALVQGAVAAWVALGREANEVIAPLMALLLMATVYNRARHILAKEE